LTNLPSKPATRESKRPSGPTGLYQAGAVVGGDEIAGDHREADGCAVRELEHRPLVPAADELPAGDPLQHLGPLAQHPLGQGLGDDQDLTIDRCPDVVDVRRHRDRLVAGQRPRRRGPHQQIFRRLLCSREGGGVRNGSALAPASGGGGWEQGKLYVDRRILNILVAERHLVRGEGGAAARAVGDDLVALVEAPVVPEPSQRPPDRLDVVVVEGHVGVVEVDPEADPLGQPVPLLDVLEDRLPAAGVELGDPELLDLLLGGDAELFFDLDLDRQPVAVPAGLAGDPVAAHRPVARVDVLEDAGEHVVGARPAVGGRRPLVEAPHLGPLPLGEGAAEDVALPPALEHPLLELGEGLPAVDWPETWHHKCSRFTNR
jgi:hypothetical protein